MFIPSPVSSSIVGMLFELIVSPNEGQATVFCQITTPLQPR